MDRAAAKWKLPQILASEKITPYRLAQELVGQKPFTSVYAIVKPDVTRADFSTLALLVWALRRLTQKKYTFDDLLEFSEDPPTD